MPPPPLTPHSQQTSTPKIKDFLRKTLSQHNKFCNRRTIAIIVQLKISTTMQNYIDSVPESVQDYVDSWFDYDEDGDCELEA